MAYTVEIIVTPGSGNVTATARSGGTGTANSSGYAITQVAGNLHTITIAEELLGPWALTAGDGNSMRLVTFSESKSEYLLSGPVDANVTHVLGEPALPADDVAKQETLLEVQAAVGDVAFGAVVVPLLGQIQSRTEGTTIRVFTQETTTITLAVVNAMGEPVDLAGMTLSLVIERAKGGDISVIEDGDIAVNESTISFAIPAEVSAAEGYHNWALRGSDGVVLMQGPLIVEYAPEVDQ